MGQPRSNTNAPMPAINDQTMLSLRIKNAATMRTSAAAPRNKCARTGRLQTMIKPFQCVNHAYPEARGFTMGSIIFACQLKRRALLQAGNHI